jgi:hypothetical protein
MAVERIPINDKKKDQEAEFRQLILEGVTKIMGKVYDRMNQVVNICFSNTHKGEYFDDELYTAERKTFYFEGLIMKSI